MCGFILSLWTVLSVLTVKRVLSASIPAIQQQQGNGNPEINPKRALSLLTMAQRRLSGERIPEGPLQDTLEFAKYGEIQTLFEMFISPEERKQILGFSSCSEFHREFASKASKIGHLQTLKRQYPVEDDESVSHVTSGLVITFDDNDFIKTIALIPCVFEKDGEEVSEGSSDFFEYYYEPEITGLNWDAVGQLKHLRSLQLCNQNIKITMRDIAQVPNSMDTLSIAGNIWAEPSDDLELSNIPENLKSLNTNYCQQMAGSLKLTTSSQSKLEELECTEIQDITDLYPLPPMLRKLKLSGKTYENPFDPETIDILRRNNIEVSFEYGDGVFY